MPAFDYSHIVSFAETNLVGNVYYANYVSWQGRCREMFLHEHAPSVLEELNNGLALVTLHVSCDYLAELFAFDEVIIRMRLVDVVQNRIQMDFEYWRQSKGRQELVARGKQEVACMRREGEVVVPAPLPQALKEALQDYATT